MSQEQIIQMLVKRIEDMENKIEKHDNRIMQILVSMGKLQVKTAMITGIFSTFGGGMTIILLKYVFKAF